MPLEVYIRGVDGSVRKSTMELADMKRGEVAFFKPAEPQEIDDGDRLLNWMAALCGKTGDFIEWAAKVLGVPPCPACQLRNMLLHRIKELGVRRAMAMLLRSIAGQFSSKGQEQIEAELKQILETAEGK